MSDEIEEMFEDSAREFERAARAVNRIDPHAPRCTCGAQTVEGAPHARTCDLEITKPTGPLTPGQVACRVCNLDDRTRAASSPVDELCDVCRADTPNRIARKRRERLEDAVEVWSGLRDLGGRITATAGDETALAIARANALLKLADIVIEHPEPDELFGSSRTNSLVEKAMAYAEKSKFGVPQDMAEVLAEEVERLRMLLGVAGGRVWLAETRELEAERRETRAVDEVNHLTDALTKAEERLTEALADKKKKGNDERSE